METLRTNSTNELMQKLAQITTRPEWDVFMVYLDMKRVNCQERLEECTPDKLNKIQGELLAIKEMLTLRSTVNKIMSAR